MRSPEYASAKTIRPVESAKYILQPRDLLVSLDEMRIHGYPMTPGWLARAIADSERGRSTERSRTRNDGYSSRYGGRYHTGLEKEYSPANGWRRPGPPRERILMSDATCYTADRALPKLVAVDCEMCETKTKKSSLACLRK